MAQALRFQQTYQQTPGGVGATIRAVLSAVTAEHTLALRAATRAASPRQSLAEVRAMYVSHQQDDAIAQSEIRDAYASAIHAVEPARMSTR